MSEPLDSRKQIARLIEVKSGDRRSNGTDGCDYRHSYATIADQLDFSVTDRLAALGHSRMPMLLSYTSKQLEGRRAGAEENWLPSQSRR